MTSEHPHVVQKQEHRVMPAQCLQCPDICVPLGTVQTVYLHDIDSIGWEEALKPSEPR